MSWLGAPSRSLLSWEDDLIAADLTDGKQTIFLGTRDGMAIRFEEEYDPERNGVGLRQWGGNAAGNRGVSN